MARRSDPLPLSIKKHIDDVCLRFEAAWQQSPRPPIEPHLQEVSEPELSALLAELLLLDVDYRMRAGEAPDVGEYSARFPNHGRIVEEVFRQSGLPYAPAGTRIRYFGDYELLEAIGRGGMGIVYKARQVSLDRLVALKMILGGRLASPEEVERFYQEARTVAGLQHPNILAIHEVGEHEGQHYFSMDYVEGTSLAEIVRRSPLAARRAALYVKTVAEAVHYAHQRGTLHRDLKPSNVLIDAADQPRITDFGLARRIEGVSDLTASGQVLGTPSYISPEQAAGNLAAVGPASDVYSLGATLYDLVTGRPPFQGETAVVTLRQVLEEEPAPPRRLNPAVPRDLDVIALRCLQKEPNRRYRSAQELADDLGRFLRGEPIRARPVGAPMRLARWCWRRPLVAGLVFALILVLLAGTGVSTYFAIEAHARAHDATDRLWESCLAQARAGRRTGRPGQRFESLAALASAAAIRSAAELRDEAIACLALVDLRPKRQWVVDPARGAMTDAAMTRYACDDGRGNVSIRRVTDDGEVAFLKSPDGRPRAHHYRFSPDGRFLVSWHEAWQAQAPECRLWDVARKRITLQTPAITWYACDFAPDGTEVAVIAPDGTIGLFDPATGKTLDSIPWELPRDQIPVWLRFHPRRRLVAALCRENTWPHVIDLEARKVVRTLSLPQRMMCQAWHPREDMLAVGCEDGKIRLISAETGEIRLTFNGHQGAVVGVDFSPGGDLLASRSWDGTGRLWESSSGRQLLQMDGDYLALEFSADGRGLRYRTRHGELGVLEVAGGREYRTLRNPAQEEELWPHSLCFSPDGRWLATADSTGVRLWDAEDFRQIGHVPPGPTAQVLFSPLGPNLFTLADGVAKRWPITCDRMTGRVRIGPLVALNADPDDRYVGISLTPDGRYLAAFHVDGKAATLSLEPPGKPVFLKDRFDPNIGALSPDGRYFAMLTPGRRGVKVWDARTGDPVRDLTDESGRDGIADGRTCVIFSPDGRWLLTSTPSDYRLWAVGPWTSDIRILQPDTDLPGPAAFSPDSQVLAVGYTRSAIRLVDLPTGDTLATLESPDTSHIDRLCFSPDGSRLAVSGGNTVRVWELAEIRRQLDAMGLDWDLPPCAPGCPDLLARVDLLVDDGQSLVVADLKTARSRWSQEQVEDSAEQLLLYHELAQGLAPDRPIRLEFVVITKTKAPAITVHPVRVDRERIERTKQVVRRVWRAIEAGSVYPSPSPLNCASCPYRGACRDWRG